MGTRGAICFVIDGQEKVVYNQYDSYPDSLGEDVAAWLRDAVLVEADVVSALRVLRAVEGEPADEDRRRFAEFHDDRVSTGDDWYSLLRHTQGKPGEILRAGAFEPATDFPCESLFCEWAYVVDFDTRTFEVYEGFRQSPPTEGRWVGRSGPHPRTGYYPVQRVAAWSFDSLPEAGAVAGLDAEDDEVNA